jgi:pimeloyl-ACP methyl ester carboxylesterase
MDVVVGESGSGSPGGRFPDPPATPRSSQLPLRARTGLRRFLPLILLALVARSVAAGEVKLKNGLVLRGTPVKVETLYTGPKKPKPSTEIVAQPILMVSQPVRRYFLPRFQAEEVALDADLGREERYTLKHERRSGSNRELALVGSYLEDPPPFDEFGRRSVRLQGPQGELQIIQGISELTPETARLNALNYKWETALPTTSIPTDQLEAILRRVTDRTNLDQRLKLARFFIQAQLYPLAERELVTIGTDFPDQAKIIEGVRQSLAQDRAQRIVAELKLRQRGGQHAFVNGALKQFPAENVAPTILREVRELQGVYDESLAKSVRVRDLLADLQSELEDATLADQVAPLRTELLANLNHAAMGRLEAFLNLSGDTSLPAADRLALALSGWVVGSDNATTDLPQAIALWQARSLVIDYLRSQTDNDIDRSELLEQLRLLEGVGPQRIAQLLPLVPDPLDALGAAPGVITTLNPTGPREELPVRYAVYLPPEYRPENAYPVIVALHAQGRTPEEEAVFWAGTPERPGQASRHGCIVVAPHYMTRENQSQYDYSARAQAQVLEALRDVGRRFHVDHDRVFLAGHLMGADAAFEIGMSHPDLFAGVIPIAGVSDQICQFYWENARHTSFFVVLGELDRDTVARNSRELERMMKARFDCLMAEYVGSGADSFYGEIHVLFDWMGRQKRNRLPPKLDMKTLRNSEQRFYWLDVGDIPTANRLGTADPDRRQVPKPLRVTAEVMQPGNRIEVTNRTGRTVLRLTPEGGFINFDKKLQVNLNGRQKFHDFVQPDLKAMLESARLTGDRHNIVWAVLEL